MTDGEMLGTILATLQELRMLLWAIYFTTLCAAIFTGHILWRIRPKKEPV